MNVSRHLSHIPGMNKPLGINLPPWLKMLAEHVLIYSIAIAVVWWVLRGVNISKELHSFETANLWLLIIATAISFLIWLFGENLLFARMFTHFHEKTRFWEVFPATAADFFLQAANALVAKAALMVFLHQRKNVQWLTSGITMVFYFFLDAILFPLLLLVAAVLGPRTPLTRYWPYYLGAEAIMLGIAAWWMWRRPRFRLEKWLYSRPSMESLRKATPRIYGELLLIRFFILAPQGILFWAVFKAFHLSIPATIVNSASPALIAITGTPVTPGGLGPMQAVTLDAFSKYAPHAKVIAASLGFSLLHLAYRLPLGFGSASFFVSRVMRTGGRPEKADQEGQGRARPTEQSLPEAGTH